MTMQVGLLGLPHTEDVVIGRRIPRCTSSWMASESSTAALPTIIIMPKDVPSARLLVWSVMQMMPSSPFGVPQFVLIGQQNHTCLQSGKLREEVWCGPVWSGVVWCGL